MKSVIIGCCLIAVAFGIPAPAPDYSKPKEASYGHPTGGKFDLHINISENPAEPQVTLRDPKKT